MQVLILLAVWCQDEFKFLDTQNAGSLNPHDLKFGHTLAATESASGGNLFGKSVAVPVDRWARIGRWKKMMEEEDGFAHGLSDVVATNVEDTSENIFNNADDADDDAVSCSGDIVSPQHGAARNFDPSEVDDHWNDVARRKAIDGLVHQKLTEGNADVAYWKRELHQLGEKNGRGFYDKKKPGYCVQLRKTPQPKTPLPAYNTLLRTMPPPPLAPP